MAMKIGISTFVNDDSIDTVSLARAIEERGFESLVVRRLRRVVRADLSPSGSRIRPSSSAETPMPRSNG
jgi:hypothetical protein